MIVLIVEDEPIIAVSLALVLESAGHTIIGPVRTRLEALELCGKHRPTLALLDINLEGRFDGVQLARTLQQQGIPSVFLSAQHAQALANRDAALGFIAKPYTATNICESLDIVAAMLAGRTPPAHRRARSISLRTITGLANHLDADADAQHCCALRAPSSRH